MRSSASKRNGNACSANWPTVRRSESPSSNNSWPVSGPRPPRPNRPRAASRRWSGSNASYSSKTKQLPPCALIHPTRCLNRSPAWFRWIADMRAAHALRSPIKTSEWGPKIPPSQRKRVARLPSCVGSISICVVAIGSGSWVAMALENPRSYAHWWANWMS